MFRAHHAHHQERQIVSTQPLVTVTLCRWPCRVQFGSELPTCTQYSHGHRFTDCILNVMAHAEKPDFVFCRIGRVHLNQRGRQFSQLLAAEVCTSALVMLDTPCFEVAWEYWLPTPFASFPFSSPPVPHRVPSGFKCTLPEVVLTQFVSPADEHNVLETCIELKIKINA
jgi:hypothetical protein